MCGAPAGDDRAMTALRQARTWPRTLLLVLTMGLASLLTSCSVTRLAYNNAAQVLTWYADGFFDLDDAQETRFKARIESVLAWHRSSALPEYRALLAELDRRAAKRLTRTDIDWAHAEGMRHYRDALDRLIPVIAVTMTELTPAQVTFLEAKLAKDNDKYRREYVKASTQDSIAKRGNRGLETVTEWAGSLDGDQETRVRRLIEDIPNINRERMADRESRQKLVLATLNGHRDVEHISRALTVALATPEVQRGPKYQSQYAAWLDASKNYVVELEKVFTDAQHERARKRIREYADEIASLLSST